jgi:xylulokinase
MALVIGVDSSTQSTKVEVRDADDGHLVASGRAPHPTTHPPRSEQDPEAWWSAFEVAMAETGRSRADIAALAIGGQQHGMVPVDASGEVIRAAKLWNDTETAPDAGWLLKQLPGGATDWADACGSVPVAAFTITKLSWLHRSEPEHWARLARVVLPHDWLTHRLTGMWTTDRGDASGTGYWSAAEERYRYDLLAIVDRDRDWSEALPAVLGPTDTAGLWGNTRVAPGTGDNMAAALGVALAPGDVVFSLGTSGTVYAVSDRPTHDPSGAVAGFADATGRFLPLVCTLNATKVTDAVMRLLGWDHGRFDGAVLTTAAGAGGVVTLPYFDGERTPNRPKATGVITGLRPDTTAEQLARAATEGVVCGLLDGLDALAAAGVDVSGRTLLVGGGSRSAAYRQVLADLSGRSITVPDGDEHVALGAAVQAAAVLHGRTPLAVAEAWGLGRGATTEPADVDRAAIRANYAARRDREG